MKAQNLFLLALLAGLILTSTAQADVVSDVSTAKDDAVVVSSATAEASISLRKDLAPGKYTSSTLIGTWSGTTSGGALAYRINRATNPVDPNGASQTRGTSTNTRNEASTVRILLQAPLGKSNTIQGNTTTGWLSLPAGTVTGSGNVYMDSTNFTLTPGTYPVGVDIAAWAY